MAFTDEQNEQIRNDLIREARRCGITIGMRKTSVEQLTEAVGISKGSFYKFFDSKELLFFTDRKSTRLNSSHIPLSRMPSSA